MTTLVLPKSHAPIGVFTLMEPRQVTVDIAAAASAYFIAPFAGRILGVVGFCHVIGGSTVHTDIDLDLQKATTTMLASVVPVVNSSAIVKTTAVVIAASATIAAARFAVLDVLNLEIDITGGSTPTADGVGLHVFYVRED